MLDKKKKDKDDILRMIRDIDEKDLESINIPSKKPSRRIEAEFVSENGPNGQIVDAISENKILDKNITLEEKKHDVSETGLELEESDKESIPERITIEIAQDTGKQKDEIKDEQDDKTTSSLSPQPQEQEISLEKTIIERDEYKDKFLRKAAELENYIKRVRKEKEELRDFTITEIILQLLPIADNFERALNVANSTTEQLLAGVKIIQQQLLDAFREYGIEPLSSQLGEKFNPEFHEAIFIEPTNDHPEHTVIEEYLKGYTYKNTVLRPVKVRVAVSKADAEDEIETNKEKTSGISSETENNADNTHKATAPQEDKKNSHKQIEPNSTHNKNTEK